MQNFNILSKSLIYQLFKMMCFCMYQMFYEFCIQCNHDIWGLCRKLEELYWWHKSHHKRLPSYTTRPSHPKTTYTFLMYVFIGHESDHWLCQGCVIFSTISDPRWDQPISDIYFLASGQLILMHRTHFIQNIWRKWPKSSIFKIRTAAATKMTSPL